MTGALMTDTCSRASSSSASSRCSTQVHGAASRGESNGGRRVGAWPRRAPRPTRGVASFAKLAFSPPDAVCAKYAVADRPT